MSFAVKAIDHVELFVSDIAVAAKWYEDVLGLKEMAGGSLSPRRLARRQRSWRSFAGIQQERPVQGLGESAKAGDGWPG